MRPGAGRDPEPEREVVRRVLPFSIPAFLIALFAGALAGGWGVGWSAALGIAVVTANLAVSGLSISYAAKISPQAMFAVATVGFVVRMGIILAILFGLDQLSWFSPLAFGLAVVPATILMLAYEMKLLAGGLDGAMIPDPASARKGRVE
jgi:ATP synthase protein I